MKFPTEYRIFIDREKEIYKGIINSGYVVNIKKSNRRKEEKVMLENEKQIKLEQLNSLKGAYEKKLADIEATDVNSLVNARLAGVEAEIRNEEETKHNEAVAKAKFQLDAIDEMIAEVEAEEVETPVDEPIADIETEETELAEVEIEVVAPIDEVQSDIPTESETNYI